jgi:translation initiation factor IF-1
VRRGSPRRHLPSNGATISEKNETIQFDGEVTETLRGRMFRVELDNGHETLAYLGGRLKRYRVRVLLGDRVRIEFSPYDLTRGRIVYRIG